MRLNRTIKFILSLLLLSLHGAAPAKDDQKAQSPAYKVATDGPTSVPEFAIPPSRYMSDEARRAFIEQRRLEHCFSNGDSQSPR